MGYEMPRLALCLPLPPAMRRMRSHGGTLSSSCRLHPRWTSLALGAIQTQLEVEAAYRGQAPPRDNYEEEGDHRCNESAGPTSMLILFLCVSILSVFFARAIPPVCGREATRRRKAATEKNVVMAVMGQVHHPCSSFPLCFCLI
jgi:hypothetical protein